ncbi:MAG: YkgJ family cysteine cluster protein [Myxococcales bacterium]|nr:YkgJ family cysteine cluster protein [Myxococcales bacterium]
METWFTFPDGALSYDCATCRQRCCRGKGFSFSADELVPLLRRAPSLAPHLQLGGGGTFRAVDLTERCWFLEESGLCELETKHGRDAKPSTCRLFPFNRVFRVGDVRVVDVNSLLCPVAAAAPGQGASHAALREEIASLEGSAVLDVPAWQPAELPADWLAKEQQIAAATVAHAADPSALAAAAGDPGTDALHAAWARTYGIAPDDLRPLEAAVAPRVALLYPSLRWNALFHKGAPAWPHSVARLPRRLRALTFLAALAARSLGAAPSLRGITELLRAQASVLAVLERFDAPVKLAEARFDSDVAPHLQTALALLLGGAYRGGRSLGEIVEMAAATLAPGERPLAVALAAQRLDTLLPP